MKVSFVKPRPELRPYVMAFWVFESALGLPQNDTNLAAPNGCPKVIILCDNSLENIVEGHSKLDPEGLYFVGNRDTSTLLRSAPRKTTIVGIEFRPHGAFPVFGIPMQETANRVYDWKSVCGSWGGEVWETFRNLPDVSSKLPFIQAHLVRLLDRNYRDNRLIDFCVNNLELANGRLAIRELEQKTGYSRRYLELLFRQHVGFPPKVLAGIFRFQKFYRRWARGLSYDLLKEELYDCYYDQAHFTKEFKRMTGHSPREFILHVHNDFGRRLSLK